VKFARKGRIFIPTATSRASPPNAHEHINSKGVITFDVFHHRD
jgi:hypothetical protein